MKNLLFFCLFVCSSVTLIAQPEICRKNYSQKLNEGIAMYNKGDYSNAARTFRDAHCPALTATQHAGLDDWAKKCAKGINANKAKKESVTSPSNNTPSTPKTQESSSVEILYSGYLKATCNDGVRGAELAVLITAKDMKNKKLRLRCLIAPQNGSGMVNTKSPLATAYTVDGGFSGQEQEIVFSPEEECVTVSVFVPFSVMDFAGDYSPQVMKSDIYVFLSNDKKPVEEYHGIYNALSPHTIAINGRTGDYTQDVPYEGGLLNINPAVCAGNDVLWEDFPSWVIKDVEGIHVMENPSPSPRTATMHVSSSGGGNVINIILNQKGRENKNATAKINQIWHEVKNSRQLNIHVDCEITGARGKEILASVFFYCSDGKTALLDNSGKQVIASGKAVANYTETYFDDFPIAMWYNSVTGATNNNSNKAVYYVYISDDGGKSWIAQSAPYTITW